MPKDLIHFTVAERTANLLSDSKFAQCLKGETDGLLLGSVFHDVLFYAALPAGKPLESLAESIHGAEGEDTFHLIRMQAKHASKTSNKALPVALLVGMISHLFADVVMHPMIWHFTGNYYADDAIERTMTRQRHRAMESLMDMAICPEKMGRTRYSVRTLLKRCPNLKDDGISMEAIARAANMDLQTTEKQFASAWKLFSIFQFLFHRKKLAHALFAIRPYLPNFFSEISMLFYAPQLMDQADFIQGTIKYKHPVTNAPLKATIEDLMDKAAELAASLCRQLEPAIFDRTPLDLNITGPSLDAGMEGVPTSAMMHFAEPPFPKLD